MKTLYHCFYREPKGDSILASCFRDVAGEPKPYLFAATHLSKALAFAFSYHDNEVLMNSGIEGTDDEIVVLCGGQETLDKPRHIRVYSFSSEGFSEIPKARQAVSEFPMPFAKTQLMLETRDINDLMREGLQIVVLPLKVEDYMLDDDQNKASQIFGSSLSPHDFLARMMRELDARWINEERGINPCKTLKHSLDSEPLPPRTLRIDTSARPPSLE